MSTAMMPRMPGIPGTTPESKRQRLNALAAQLKDGRTSFEAHWKEIGDLFRPRRVRLNAQDRNKGDKRSQKIVDSTTIFAARTLSSGIMSAVTSPARSWQRQVVTDKSLKDVEAVKIWLDDVREGMDGVMHRSNFYEILSTYYSDLGVFGTTAMLVEEDDDKVIRCIHFAIGEYWLGYDSRQRPRVFMREFELTVRQVVEQFGKKTADGYETANLSSNVQSQWQNGGTEKGVTVRHLIYENPDYEETRIESKHKRFASCYYEVTGQSDVFLDEGGYDEWPVMAVRWEVTTGDVYGTDCPGMTALGDAKELMFSKKVGAQALNKSVNPPMVGPTTMKNVPLSILPGGVSYFDETTDKKFRPAVDTSTFRLDYLSKWIDELRGLIDRAFFVDMFLLISQIDRGDVTATEVLEKKEEKLLTLGPVGKQIDGGFLDPFFDRLYGIMFRRGMIPQPPQEMEGQSFHPEYESIMAQAQRAQGRQGIDAFAGFLIEAAKVDPSTLDLVDMSEMVKKYADVTGVSPKFLKDDDVVAGIRKARAQVAAQQQAVKNASEVSGAAKNLAGADLTSNNALTALMGGGGADVLGGSNGPVGGI